MEEKKHDKTKDSTTTDGKLPIIRKMFGSFKRKDENGDWVYDNSIGVYANEVQLEDGKTRIELKMKYKNGENTVWRRGFLNERK